MTKQMAVYKHLKPIYEKIGEIKHLHTQLQSKIDNLYTQTSIEEAKDYINNFMSEDELELEIDNLKLGLIEYEKILETKYNEWKFDHYGQDLFIKLDSTLFDIDILEFEE